MVITLRSHRLRQVRRGNQALERMDERGESLRGQASILKVLHQLRGHQKVPQRLKTQHHKQHSLPRRHIPRLPQLHPETSLSQILQ